MRRLPSRLVLLGHPVTHSLSPTFQNVALRRAGLPLRYEALDVPPETLPATLADLVSAGAAGNVTIPHKEAVAARCARLTPLAARVGAVNTFWVDDDALVGDNTDVGGFLGLLRATAPDVDRSGPVAVIGAGGSAAAVLTALETEQFTDIRVHARTRLRAERLAERFAGTRVALDAREAMRDATLVINATPVGLDNRSMPVDPALIDDAAAVLDLVALRGETPLVHAARARGCRAAGGLGMLVEQGALAFERWFGIAPDRAAMHDALAD